MKFGKYLNIKITPNKGEINIKANSKFIFVLVLLIDLVDNKDKNYYPQVFLGTCKYVAKKIASEEENSIDSDEEYSDEKWIILINKNKYIKFLRKKYIFFGFLGLGNSLLKYKEFVFGKI